MKQRILVRVIAFSTLLPVAAHAQASRSGDAVSMLLVGALVVLLAFLIGREIVCWYWKINQSVALLTEIRDLLKPGGGKPANESEPLGPGI